MDGIIDIKTIIHLAFETLVITAVFVWFRKKTNALEEKVLELEKTVATHKTAIENLIGVIGQMQQNAGFDPQQSSQQSQQHSPPPHSQNVERRRNQKDERKRPPREQQSAPNISARRKPQNQSHPSHSEPEHFTDTDEDEVLGRELNQIKRERVMQDEDSDVEKID